MVSLSLDANVQFMTVMATKMPISAVGDTARSAAPPAHRRDRAATATAWFGTGVDCRMQLYLRLDRIASNRKRLGEELRPLTTAEKMDLVSF